jgi:hypothetical protein
MAMVCEWFGLKTTWTVFVGLASKPVVTVSSGLGSKLAPTVSGGLSSKPTVTVFGGLASKPAATVSGGLASKPAVTVFFSLASKLVVMVSPSLASKPDVSFLVEPQNKGGGGFPGLGHKKGSSSLVIWASKSPRRFLGLGLKTMRASVCRLHHKINGGRSAWDTRRDIATCFTWKQVWLGFLGLPKNWRWHDDWWCTWHHRGGCIGGKLKTDGSMRWAASDPTTLPLSFSMC